MIVVIDGLRQCYDDNYDDDGQIKVKTRDIVLMLEDKVYTLSVRFYVLKPKFFLLLLT